MSDPSEPPWSNNPNAPQIPYWLHFGEKVYFAGVLMGAVFYGTHSCTSVYLPSPQFF